MGGFTEPQITPPSQIDLLPPALHPFREQMVKAVANMFGQPGGGVTPLEESTIRGTFQQAQPMTEEMMRTAQGSYLPGQANANPFMQSLVQSVEGQGDIARRQLAGAAQKAGVLSGGSDYMQQAGQLESQLYNQKGNIFANVFENERGRQMQAPGQMMNMGQGLLGMAGVPRQVATDSMLRPFQLGQGLMGGSSQVTPGSRQPSPFASLLSGLAPFFGLFG